MCDVHGLDAIEFWDASGTRLERPKGVVIFIIGADYTSFDFHKPSTGTASRLNLSTCLHLMDIIRPHAFTAFAPTGPRAEG